MKRVIIALICCLISVGAYAQKPVNFGFNFGYANSSSSLEKNDVLKSFKDANGFSAGAFLRYNIKKFYIQPSVNYVFMKSSSSNAGSVKMNYFQVPVVLGYTILNAKVFSLRALVGPQVDILAKENTKGADFNTATWSGKAGLGIDIGSITVDLNYRIAFTETGADLGKSKGFNVAVGFKVF